MRWRLGFTPPILYPVEEFRCPLNRRMGVHQNVLPLSGTEQRFLYCLVAVMTTLHHDCCIAVEGVSLNTLKKRSLVPARWYSFFLKNVGTVAQHWPAVDTLLAEWKSLVLPRSHRLCSSNSYWPSASITFVVNAYRNCFHFPRFSGQMS